MMLHPDPMAFSRRAVAVTVFERINESWIAATAQGADRQPMAKTRPGNLSARFVGGAAGVGALIGWRAAAKEALPHVVCAHFAKASTQIAHCFNRSVVAEVIHWGLPMLAGFIVAGVAATGVVVILRGLRARTA
jgi:hypothetical protein